ncbi:hypothetical protein U2261_25720 [Achromobacter xylosoxidans]|jgi:hypothetical protein|uniref:Uncharacterized protein n=1 Tax=Achromobacter ruhlandii TaxID=72557 RepID=A0A848NGU6_9BURK|nr:MULTISPECIES: hypothetical protein [Achromobacter]MDZ5618037.1 hypothetical protein [Achromobacter xylosoxidans]MDZ5625874.1 hypothetical protein [Achromobacter xylosoxidans]MDZ5685464.1 hypothetical protein [Achromobacter xylosoxidans]NMU89783.1 hypothetical protein [Achromobacter ruhlandii]
MNPITPLGKPLRQQPVPGADVPLSLTATRHVEEPVTALQWVSVARATWNWILRPLWYIFIKWPLQLLVVPSSRSTSDDDEPDWLKRHNDEVSQRRVRESKW